jgi:hypothetical protein
MAGELVEQNGRVGSDAALEHHFHVRLREFGLLTKQPRLKGNLVDSPEQPKKLRPAPDSLQLRHPT